MQRRIVFIVLALSGLLTGCATLPPGERDPRDRFERTNRAVYRFNDGLDRHIARPLAKGYVKVTPRPVRTGVSNFFQNLFYPTVIVNDLLQGKLKSFGGDTARLVVNTTLGIGGLFDPATQMGLPAGDEDFGQTLGKWGLNSGPYLVIPLLGPSTFRDFTGRAVDSQLSWARAVDHDRTMYSIMALEVIDLRASLLGAGKSLDEAALDKYQFLRDAYLQRRLRAVNDGKVSQDKLDQLEDDLIPPKEAPRK